jgi:hypothetical protein
MKAYVILELVVPCHMWDDTAFLPYFFSTISLTGYIFMSREKAEQTVYKTVCFAFIVLDSGEACQV